MEQKLSDIKGANESARSELAKIEGRASPTVVNAIKAACLDNERASEEIERVVKWRTYAYVKFEMGEYLKVHREFVFEDLKEMVEANQLTTLDTIYRVQGIPKEMFEQRMQANPFAFMSYIRKNTEKLVENEDRIVRDRISESIGDYGQNIKDIYDEAKTYHHIVPKPVKRAIDALMEQQIGWKRSIRTGELAATCMDSFIYIIKAREDKLAEQLKTDIDLTKSLESLKLDKERLEASTKALKDGIEGLNSERANIETELAPKRKEKEGLVKLIETYQATVKSLLLTINRGRAQLGQPPLDAEGLTKLPEETPPA